MNKGSRRSLSLITGGLGTGDRDDAWELVPGTGIGPIRFGMSPEQAVAACGSAGTRRIDEDGDLEIEFEALGIVAYFCQEDDGRLSLLETDLLKPCSLWGSNLSPGLDRRGVRTLIEDNHPPSTSEANVVEIGLDETSISISSLAITFYFDLAGLSSVSFGVMFGPDDEPIWPQ